MIEYVLYVIIRVWSLVWPFMLIVSIFPPFCKRIDCTSHEIGKNVHITKNFFGDYDVTTSPIYSDDYYYVFSRLGRFLRSVGVGGVVNMILYKLKDILVEFACLCTLGIVDLRDNNLIVYICILGSAILTYLLTFCCCDVDDL